MPERRIYNDFSGGINNNSPPNQIEDNEVVDALNMIFDRRSNLKVRPGLTRINWNKNLLQRTEEFDNAYWVKTNVTITPNTDTAPDSTLTADSANATVASGSIRPTDLTPQNNETYTFLISIKKQDPIVVTPNLRIIFTGATQIVHEVSLNLSTGLTTIIVGTPISHGSIDFDDYYLFWITGKNNASGNTLLRFNFYPAGIGTGTCVIWGAQVTRGVLSDYHKNVATAPTQAANYIFNKITSVYDYKVSDGTKALIATAGADIYRLNASDYFDKITGGLTLPSGTYWKWAVYDDELIGVNRGGSATSNPIKISGISSNAVALGGTPPTDVVDIEIWNNRVWLLHGNVVTCSALGLPEDYTTVGKAGTGDFEVGGQEGDLCTAIKAHRDRLFIFKSDSIYYITPGSPNTDIEQYEIILLTDKIGCVSSYSIQIILNDLVFLSKFGLSSLSAVEQFGNFAESIISNKIRDLNNFRQEDVNSAACLDPTESQYLLAAPFDGGSNHSALWIMDYTNIQNRIVGFTRANGKIVGASLANVEYNGQKRVYVGGYPQATDEGISYVYRYGDLNVYNDDGSLYDAFVETKSLSPGEGIINSEFIRVYFIIELITSDLDLSLSYKYDESSAKIKSWVANFTGDIYIGSIWDTALWDTGVWASPDTLERRIKRLVIGSPGRIARAISGRIVNTVIDQGFIFKAFGFDFEAVTHLKD